MKKRIVSLVEQGENGAKINRHFDYFIVALILLNVIAVVIDTDPRIHEKYMKYFHWFEIFSVTVFTAEYLLRIYVSDITHPSSSRWKSALKFICSGYGMVDLVAILPFYLPFIVSIDLRILRMLRFLRFARLLKMSRYNKSLTILWNVVKLKRIEFAIVGFAALVILTVSATIMYFVEGPVQPEKFHSIGDSFYWAISTVTSLGYGDVHPVTAMGKVLASVLSIMGVGLFAVPTGIISSAFIELRNKRKYKCPHCGGEIDILHLKNHGH